MSKLSLVGFLLMAFSTACLAQQEGSIAEQEVAGWITDYDGEVWIETSDGKKDVDREEFPVHVGEVVHTGERSLAKIHFLTGSSPVSLGSVR